MGTAKIWRLQIENPCKNCLHIWPIRMCLHIRSVHITCHVCMIHIYAAGKSRYRNSLALVGFWSRAVPLLSPHYPYFAGACCQPGKAATDTIFLKSLVWCDRVTSWIRSKSTGISSHPLCQLRSRSRGIPSSHVYSPYTFYRPFLTSPCNCNCEKHSRSPSPELNRFVMDLNNYSEESQSFVWIFAARRRWTEFESRWHHHRRWGCRRWMVLWSSQREEGNVPW